jgi:hypothetical protein
MELDAGEIELIIRIPKALLLLESLILAKAFPGKRVSFSILYILFVRQTQEMA